MERENGKVGVRADVESEEVGIPGFVGPWKGRNAGLTRVLVGTFSSSSLWIHLISLLAKEQTKAVSHVGLFQMWQRLCGLFAFVMGSQSQKVCYSPWGSVLCPDPWPEERCCVW